MKRNYLLTLLLFGIFVFSHACTSVTPSFTITNSHTCGIPGVMTIVNTSTGTLASSVSTKYYWKLGGVLVDSTFGLAAPQTILLKNSGTYSIKIIAVDSTNCKDSFNSSATITSTAPLLNDQNGLATYTPEWINCIVFRTDTDSFKIKITSLDTLRNPTVIWGDGSINSTATKLNPGDSIAHYYKGTGIFTYKVILFNASTSCTDTLYGKVINQRQPTAGIKGPSSGQNRGCAPHAITFKNASFNVTKETTITWLFGDGKGAVTNPITDPDSITHIYESALCNGTVTLTAKNACGSSQTTWNPIDISEKDKAIIEVDTSNCNPKIPFVFHNKTADLYCSNPDPKQYYWDFGDGDTTGWILSKASQSHVYENPGKYTVMLIAKNTCGLDTTYFSFTAIFSPKPNFILSDSFGCQPVTITATDVSKGWKITRNWNFGSGSTSTDSIATHTYTKGGTYTLTLSASNSCGKVDTTFVIEVYDVPVADIALRGSGCISHNQTFTNRSTIYTDSTTYSWSFGDGTSSTLRNPALKSYTVADNYNVILKITNTCGNSSDTANFNAFGFPVISTISDSTICTFDTFSVNVSTNITSSFVVNWGNGKTSNYSNSGNFTHVYDQSGLVSIIITAIGNGGCSTKDTVLLNVKPGALAKFSVPNASKCAPALFTISNISKNATNYWWYANDSLISTSATFSAYSIENDSSIINLKLKTANAGFCDVDSFSISLFTPKNPSAKFTTKDTAGCGPLKPAIDNLSIHATSFNWSFGSTLKSPLPSFSSSTTKDTFYQITLIAKNWAGCADTVSDRVLVYPLPTVNFSMVNPNGCGPLNTSFTNLSSPNDTGNINIMSFNWNFGNTTSLAKNTNHVFTASNTKDSQYTTKLIGTSEHGCKDSISKNITVFPKPKALFTPSTLAGCAPLRVDFDNKSIPFDTGSIKIMTFDWLFNNSLTSPTQASGIFVGSLTKDTFHKVRLIAKSEHGCRDTSLQNIQVYPIPEAVFTADLSNGCSPLKINFTNTSKAFDTSTINDMKFNWNLGNGNNSTLKDPSNTYLSQANNDKSYQVSLIANSEHGCVDTFVKTITAHPAPVAAFSSDKISGCGPLPVQFNENGINTDTLYWNFGNGWQKGSRIETNIFNPILLFDTVYYAQLTSTSIHGCTGDTATKPIRVLGIPKASFSLSKDTSCNEEVTLFYNTSLAAIKYEWSFGDQTTSRLINPTKIFKADNVNGLAITYAIKLKATSLFGCLDSMQATFTATPLPKAKIGLDKAAGCGDLTINFTNNSQFGKTQKWSFGEGSSTETKNPNFTFTNNTPTVKKYAVTLESFASAGCNAIDTATVTVYPKPFITATASRTDVCDSGRFQFILQGSSAQTINWTFGDGSPKTNSSFSSAPNIHYFPRSTYGDTSFITAMVATSALGCKDSIIKTITLGPKVVAHFDPTPVSACIPAKAIFKNLSRNATNFVWEFGDGGGSGDFNPTYTYNSAGNYSVKLTAFDKNGCRDISLGTNNFLALETPVAEFVMSSGQLKLPNAKAIFSNLTRYTQPTQFEWDFGDGSATSSLENPTHTYSDSGTFQVRLLAQNNSCQNVIIKQLLVDPSLPIVDFDPEVAAGCAPLSVQFKEKTLFANKFKWDFGDGNSSEQANPNHVYENNGFYAVTLIAEGPGGSSKIVKTSIIEVKITPRCYFYASPENAYLPNARFDMDNKTINASQYAWKVNKNDDQLLVATSTDKNPSFILNEVGDYDVTLIATNTNQCHDTLTQPLLMIVLEEGKIFVPTGFTPNRDNVNDVFKPVMFGVVESDYVFRVFDRWGAKVFETTDKNQGWDGTVLGQPVAENVFVWTINGKFSSGFFFNKKGTITLLK